MAAGSPRRILFFDPACPSPYTAGDLNAPPGALGGTEATVVRVAEKLGECHDVIVAQHNRTRDAASDRVRYMGPEGCEQPGLDAVVVVRREQALAC